MRYALLALLLAVAWPAAAADDDFRVMKLEQDVRNLEREVQGLTRQLAELKSQLAAAGGPVAPRPKPAAPAGQTATWLDAGNWKRVRPGMSEFEVISILGVPASTRPEQRERVLIYATEVGASGFLVGRVVLRDGQVTEIVQPVLK